MLDFSYEAQASDYTIDGMLGELKELLVRENDSQSNCSQLNGEMSDALYFTFLGSSEDRSVLVDCPSPIEKQYTSETLGEFFKINDREGEALCSKIGLLKDGNTRNINENLKRKISDKIFNL